MKMMVQWLFEKVMRCHYQSDEYHNRSQIYVTFVYRYVYTHHQQWYTDMYTHCPQTSENNIYTGDSILFIVIKQRLYTLLIIFGASKSTLTMATGQGIGGRMK